MQLSIIEGWESDYPPCGVFVVIDVLRACTTAHTLLALPSRRLIVEEGVERARVLRDELSGARCFGERGGHRLEGYDYGNSPVDAAALAPEVHTVILNTTNGVRGTLKGLRAGGRVLLAGYVNAAATCRWLQQHLGPELQASFVATSATGDEDLACAEYMCALLRDEAAPSPAEVERRIRASQAAAKFLDEEQPEFDPRDLDLCARQDADGYVLEAVRATHNDWIEVKRV